MPRLIPLVFLCLLISCNASSQLYKWVDKDGNTHYSDQLPSDQSVEFDEFKVGKKAKKKQASATNSAVVGQWWSMTNSGVRTLFTHEGGSFTIHKWDQRNSQLDSIFIGKWTQAGEHIVLTYHKDVKNRINSQFIGLSQMLKVQSVQDTRLTLIWPNERQHPRNYVRLNTDNFMTNYKTELIMGDWFDDDKKRLELNLGSFEFAEARHSKALAEGNWQLNDNDELIMEYIYDFSKDPNGKVGDVYKWKVIKLDEENLLLRNMANQKLWRFDTTR